jgi:hypothetical protein
VADGGGLFGAEYVPPIPDAVRGSSQWRRLAVRAWSSHAAIHCLEARARLLRLSFFATVTCHWNIEIVSIGDNKAEVLATGSGRARDAELNVTGRRARAVQVGTQIRWRRRHIDTVRNISDDDRRLADNGALRPGGTLYGEHFDRRQQLRPVRAPEAVRSLAPPGKYLLEFLSRHERLSCAVLASGMRIAQSLEACHGPSHDIRRPHVQRTLLQWLRSRLLWAASIAVPCAVDSLACHARRGAAQIAERESLLRFVERFIKEAIECGVHILL